MRRSAPTPEELLLARRMVRKGALAAEVHAALGWTASVETTAARLRKYGIPVRLSNKPRSHWGDETWTDDKREK